MSNLINGDTENSCNAGPTLGMLCWHPQKVKSFHLLIRPVSSRIVILFISALHLTITLLTFSFPPEEINWSDNFFCGGEWQDY